MNTGKLKSLIFDLVRDKMQWRGDWFARTFNTSDVSLDNGWLGVAKRRTTDNIEPINKGLPEYIYQGIIGTNSVVSSQIVFGQQYTFPTDLNLSGYRVYTIAGNQYSVYVVDSVGQITGLISFVAGNTGWVESGLAPRILPTGTQFSLVVVVAEPDPTPTTTNLDYDYLTPNNFNVPLSGTIVHANQVPGVLRVSKTDNNAVDQSVFLATLNIGDTIDSLSISWAIQSITDQGMYYDFAVAPAQQDSPDGVFSFGFNTVTPTPITYAEDVNYFLGDTEVRGLFTSTGGISDVVEDDNAYGVDILVNEIVLSDDWDLLAFNQSASSSNNQNQLSQLSARPIVFESLGLSTTNAQFALAPVSKLLLDQKIEGDFIVTLSYEAYGSAANRRIKAGLYIDTVLVDTEYEKEPKNSSDLLYVSKTFPYTFTGFTNFRFDFGKAGGAGGSTVSIQNLRIIMVRV